MRTDRHAYIHMYTHPPQTHRLGLRSLAALPEVWDVREWRRAVFPALLAACRGSGRAHATSATAVAALANLVPTMPAAVRADPDGFWRTLLQAVQTGAASATALPRPLPLSASPSKRQASSTPENDTDTSDGPGTGSNSTGNDDNIVANSNKNNSGNSSNSSGNEAGTDAESLSGGPWVDALCDLLRLMVNEDRCAHGDHRERLSE
jgi:hypothetical protein